MCSDAIPFQKQEEHSSPFLMNCKNKIYQSGLSLGIRQSWYHYICFPPIPEQINHVHSKNIAGGQSFSRGHGQSNSLLNLLRCFLH